MTKDLSVPGIADGSRLAQWMGQQGSVSDGGDLAGIELIAGGRSNLTYRLDFGSSARLVLRRPPLGHVLPTAHDMAREYRVLTALNGTAIPVPAPVALCADPEIIGAPFYLMEYVDGLVLRSREDGEQVTAEQAGQLSERLAGMLAAIHGVDTEAVGLSDFGRPEGYLGQAAGPLAAAVGAVGDARDARLPAAGRAADGGAAGDRRGRAGAR